MTSVDPVFRLGLIINPYAGIGGALALKGSDGKVIREKALAMGAQQQAMQKTQQALSFLQPFSHRLMILCCAGDMGENLCISMGLSYQVVHTPVLEQTEAIDTEEASNKLLEAGIDLLVFAGGDGTARNVFSIVREKVPVLGMPAGCKIHSGVFAVTPAAAGRVIQKMVKGDLVSTHKGWVMDIDEQAFREGRVQAKPYGEMWIPHDLSYVQSVKVAGAESEQLVKQDIADYLAEIIFENAQYQYFMGSGSTVAEIMRQLNLEEENTLLGIDLVRDGELLGKDLDATQIKHFADQRPSKLVISLIGGQGHVFGRGNQQLSPTFVSGLGWQNIYVVASKTKLKGLNGRPIVVDTGDPQLNRRLSGTIRVITGYQDEVLYPATGF
jgi:predicted polyphosphate/ATP-dependent NAD kinase